MPNKYADIYIHVIFIDNDETSIYRKIERIISLNVFNISFIVLKSVGKNGSLIQVITHKPSIICKKFQKASFLPEHSEDVCES